MKRLSAFCKFSEIEVKDEANEHISREAEVLLVKEKEGNRVLEKLSDQDFVVLLVLHGKMIDSEFFVFFFLILVVNNRFYFYAFNDPCLDVGTDLSWFYDQ